LERIGAAMEQRWSLECKNRKKESRNDEEGSKDSSRESQEKGTPLFVFC